MMYTMPKNLLSICVNFTLATQRFCSQKAGKFEGRMLDLEDLPALLCKTYKLK